MDEPLIQIVDEHDNIVGSATIDDAQAQGLYHRVVRVMVFDVAGRLLLQKRSSAMETFPDCWDNSAAGHVDTDTNYDGAAARKLLKELGISSSLKKLGNYSSVEPYQNLRLKRFTTAYETRLESPEAIDPNETEISEIGWFSLAEARSLVAEQPDAVTPGLQDVILNYYSQ